MSTFRITTMTCMACGHEQRCKMRLVDEVEIAPDCHACGRDDSWMSLPTIPVPELTERQRNMTGIMDAIENDRGCSGTWLQARLDATDSVYPYGLPPEEAARRMVERLLHPSAAPPSLSAAEGLPETLWNLTEDDIVNFARSCGIEIVDEEEE